MSEVAIFEEQQSAVEPWSFKSMVDFALREGCGSSLDEVLEDSEFEQLLDKYEKKHSDESIRAKIVGQAGVHHFGTLLNAGLSEKRAVHQSRNHRAALEPASTVELALVEFTGQKLIEAAKQNIEEGIKEKFSSWTSMTAEEQLDLLFEAMSYFHANKWEDSRSEDEALLARKARRARLAVSLELPEGEIRDDFINMDLLPIDDYISLLNDVRIYFAKERQTNISSDKLVRALENDEVYTLTLSDIASDEELDVDAIHLPQRDYRTVLPDQFGAWPKSTLRPNCLGMSTLLVALLEEAGAEFKYVNQLASSDPYVWEVAQKNYQAILDALEELGVDYHHDVADKIRENIDYADSYMAYSHDFHHYVLVRLQDNTWITFDPFLGHIGHAAEAGEIESATADLAYHPGIARAPMSNGYKELIRFSETIEMQVRLAAYLSKRIKTLHYDSKEQIPDTFAKLEAKVHQYLDEGVAEFGYEGMLEGDTKDSFSWVIFWEDLCVSHARGLGIELPYNPYKTYTEEWSTKFESVMDRLYDIVQQRILTDREYAERSIEDLITFPLRKAKDLLSAMVETRTKHSADFSYEIMQPQFAVGLFTLNHLQSRHESGTISLSEDLFRMSNSQLLLHDVMLRPEWYSDTAVQTARQMLEILPEDTLQPRLAVLAYLDKESTHGSGESRPEDHVPPSERTE